MRIPQNSRIPTDFTDFHGFHGFREKRRKKGQMRQKNKFPESARIPKISRIPVRIPRIPMYGFHGFPKKNIYGMGSSLTLALRFSDPLWLAQELLMSPKVMENPALVHFKSVQEQNTEGTRCYSELYTGNWCVLQSRVCPPCFAFASNCTHCTSELPCRVSKRPFPLFQTHISPVQTPVLH